MKGTMRVHRNNATISRVMPDSGRGRYWMLERDGHDVMGYEMFKVRGECDDYQIACELVEEGHSNGAPIVYDPTADTAVEWNGEHWIALWSL